MAVNNFKLLGHIVKNNLKEAFSSKSDAFMNVIIMLINNLSFVFMWWVLFQNKGSINGWSFNHVLLMTAFTNLGFAIYAVFFRGVESIPQYIENGSLDNYITTPRNILFMVSTSESTFSNWGDVLTAVILFIMSGYLSPADVVLFLVLGFSCFITIFSFRLILSSFSFFKDNMDRLGNNVFMSFLIFSSLPASIFGGWYKVIFLTIIPAGFISLVPVNIANSFNWMAFVFLIGFNVIIFTISYFIFYQGLKKYSSGNKFGIR